MQLQATTPPRWQQFLDEKYDGGKKQVPNTDHLTRTTYPQVSVSTLLKRDTSFRKKLEDEYKAWSKQHSSPSNGGSSTIPAEATPPKSVVDFASPDSHTGAVVNLLDAASRNEGVDADVAEAFKDHLDKAKEEVLRASKRKDLSPAIMKRIRETADFLNETERWVSVTQNMVDVLLGEKSDKDKDTVQLDFSDARESKSFVSRDAILASAAKHKSIIANKPPGKNYRVEKKGLTPQQRDLGETLYTAMSQKDRVLLQKGVNVGLAFQAQTPSEIDDFDKKFQRWYDGVSRGALDKKEQAFFAEQYSFTQAFFENHKIQTVTLYRNVSSDPDENGEYELDEEGIQTWTLDPFHAQKGSGTVVSVDMPVWTIVQSPLSNPNLGSEYKIHTKGQAITAREAIKRIPPNPNPTESSNDSFEPPPVLRGRK